MIEEYIDDGTAGDSVVLTIKNMQEKTQKESEVTSKVDLILRSLLHRRILPEKLPSSRVQNFLNLVLALACKELCNGPLPISLLNEFMDCKTVAECEILFGFLERNVATLKSEALFSKVKIVILRGCNDLLRRLYPNQDMIFSGRILIFLANFFYIYERSGLNLTSEFHTDPGMFYSYDNSSSNGEGSSKKEKENGIKEEEEDVEKKIGKDMLLSDTFFINFWQLQDFFRNPANSVKERSFDTMQKCCDTVLSIFKSFNDKGIDSQLQNEVASIKDHQEREGFLLRYLTSRKLFQIQLEDSTFRRQILLQIIILFQYFTTKVKFRPASLELTPEQEKWIKESEEKAFDQLAGTGRDGKKFCKSVQGLFRREENWSKWKNEQCPEIVSKRPKLENAEEIAQKIKATHSWINKRAALMDELFNAKKQCRTLVGTEEMNTLWGELSNMDACTSDERYFTPNKDDHFDFFLTQTEEEKAEQVFGSNFIWSSFRLLGEQGNSFFVPKNWSSGKSISQYLADHINASGDPKFAEDEA